MRATIPLLVPTNIQGMPRIYIPTPLRIHANDQSTVHIEGATVGEVLRGLIERYPTLKQHLYDEGGTLRPFVNVYRNDDDIRYLDGEETGLDERDELSIVPSIAGGVEVAEAARDIELTRDEIRRYSRHLILPEFGMEGQKRLKGSAVLLVGAGGLGSPLALYLAAAGVGKIGLVDFDVVDETNLQRQIIHGTKDVGRKKLDSARETLLDVNPFVEVETHDCALTSVNALDIFAGYDAVADGTDNFPTRYLVNDACIRRGMPNVYASIFRFEGQVSVFGMEGGPCYRCLYAEPPPPGLVPSCAEGGVLGVLPGLVGTMQATEVIKVLTGIGEPLVGRLLIIDALQMSFRALHLRRNPHCLVCGDHPTQTELIDYQAFCGMPTQANQTPGRTEEPIPRLTVHELKQLLDQGQRPFILDVRKAFEYDIANLGGTLIPLDELPDRLPEIEARKDEDIVVHCRTGIRSARAVRLMREHGFSKACNLEGGVIAWSEDVDPSIPRY